MAGIGDNSVARDQLRAVVDRILRVKEEQDALAGDIRDIYAEAKANGLDKTALGLVVAQLRKRAKDPAKYEELSEIASLYLTAYEGGTPVATRARTRVRDRSAPAMLAEGTASAEPAADEGSAPIPDQPAVLTGTQGVATHASDESVAPITDRELPRIDPPQGANGEARAAEMRATAKTAPVPNPELDIPEFLRRT